VNVAAIDKNNGTNETEKTQMKHFKNGYRNRSDSSFYPCGLEYTMRSYSVDSIAVDTVDSFY